MMYLGNTLEYNVHHVIYKHISICIICILFCENTHLWKKNLVGEKPWNYFYKQNWSFPHLQHLKHTLKKKKKKTPYHNVVLPNAGEQYTKIAFYNDAKCVLMKLANYAEFTCFK